MNEFKLAYNTMLKNKIYISISECKLLLPLKKMHTKISTLCLTCHKNARKTNSQNTCNTESENFWVDVNCDMKEKNNLNKNPNYN